MRLPTLPKALPDRLALSVSARWYVGKRRLSGSIYQAASLRHASGITMKLIPGDVISDFIAAAGLYELELTRRLVKLARANGGLLVDIGANLGYFSLLWAAAREENHSVAFEVAPRNVGIMRENIDRNRLAHRVTLLEFAVSNATERRGFGLGPADQSGWGGLSPAGDAGDIEVQAVRVDEALPPDVRVALMKIDIEGADALALMGSERLLRKRAIGEIWYEANRPRMQSLGIAEDAAQDFLRSVGYVVAPMSPPSAPIVTWRALPA